MNLMLRGPCRSEVVRTAGTGLVWREGEQPVFELCLRTAVAAEPAAPALELSLMGTLAVTVLLAVPQVELGLRFSGQTEALSAPAGSAGALDDLAEQLEKASFATYDAEGLWRGSRRSPGQTPLACKVWERLASLLQASRKPDLERWQTSEIDDGQRYFAVYELLEDGWLRRKVEYDVLNGGRPSRSVIKSETRFEVTGGELYRLQHLEDLLECQGTPQKRLVHTEVSLVRRVAS
jgi:hypothetical protein